MLTALLLMLLSACTSSSEPLCPSDNTADLEDKNLPIEIVAGRLEQTRAATIDPLETVYDNFQLVGFKKMPVGTRQYVFSRDALGTTPYEVHYNDGVWHYHDITYSGGSQYLKFWDLAAAYYQFSACAPVSSSVSFNNEGQLIISDLTTSDNPLECSYKRTKTPLGDYDLLVSATDQLTPAPSNMWSAVPLRFHHVLSKICFKIYNSEGTPLKIDNFKIEISNGEQIHTAASTYTQPSTFDYDTSLDINDVCNITSFSPELYSGSSRATATELFSTRVMPQNITNINAVITISYDGATNKKALIPLGDKWDKDKVYVYVLVIGPALILSEIEVEKWELGAEEEEVFTDW